LRLLLGPNCIIADPGCAEWETVLRAVGSNPSAVVTTLHHRCHQLRCRARCCAWQTGKGRFISPIRCHALTGTIPLQRVAAAAPVGLAANTRAATGSAIDDPNGVAGEGASLPPAACS